MADAHIALDIAPDVWVWAQGETGPPTVIRFMIWLLNHANAKQASAGGGQQLC